MSSVATQVLGYVRTRTVAFAMPSSSSYRNPSMNSSHHEDCLIVHVELRPFQGTQMDLHSGKWCRDVGKKKRPAQKSQDIINQNCHAKLLIFSFTASLSSHCPSNLQKSCILRGTKRLAENVNHDVLPRNTPSLGRLCNDAKMHPQLLSQIMFILNLKKFQNAGGVQQFGQIYPEKWWVLFFRCY